jgi:DNA-binding response OmpR family regulator
MIISDLSFFNGGKYLKYNRYSYQVTLMADQKKILVIDDDEDIRRDFKEIIETENYKVETAADGATAISMVEAKYYHLALLDLKLPDMMGDEVLKKIRTLSPKTVVLMVTGYPTIDNAVESLNFGAAAYLTKPVIPQELLQFIKDKLSQQEIIASTVDSAIPAYLDLIKDGNLWSIESIASKLQLPRERVERISQFFSQYGMIKYWRNKNIVQLGMKEKKLPVS